MEIFCFYVGAIFIDINCLEPCNHADMKNKEQISKKQILKIEG